MKQIFIENSDRMQWKPIVVEKGDPTQAHIEGHKLYLVIAQVNNPYEEFSIHTRESFTKIWGNECKDTTWFVKNPYKDERQFRKLETLFKYLESEEHGLADYINSDDDYVVIKRIQ